MSGKALKFVVVSYVNFLLKTFQSFDEPVVFFCLFFFSNNARALNIRDTLCVHHFLVIFGYIQGYSIYGNLTKMKII